MANTEKSATFHKGEAVTPTADTLACPHRQQSLAGLTPEDLAATPFTVVGRQGKRVHVTHPKLEGKDRLILPAKYVEHATV